MTDRKPTTNELLRELDNEIFAAQMKVALDLQLGRETAPIVKRLAAMKMPPIVELPPEPEEIQPVRTRPRRIMSTSRSRRFHARQINTGASHSVPHTDDSKWITPEAATTMASQRGAHSIT
ncbi:hypothetical protein [Arthrobacter bussei]|uniref:Uncharacterized protein n=1 Tax=Arthrobacter bussei TaxID=2594179 RepID=A0A7X1TPX7_9MICC|nr:hypothetical protein [Arthrobacter bussei]MPY12100.1 hypothetical protein [Arthrobacter bussei]